MDVLYTPLGWFVYQISALSADIYFDQEFSAVDSYCPMMIDDMKKKLTGFFTNTLKLTRVPNFSALGWF